MRVAIDGVQRRQGYTLDLRPPSPQRAAPLLRPGRSVQAYPIDGMMRQVATAVPMEVTALPTHAPTRPLRQPWAWSRIAMAALFLTVTVAGGLAYRSASTASAARSQPTTTPPAAAQPTPKAAPAATPPGPTAAQLQAIVNQSTATAGVPTSIETIDLANGATATSNADAVFTSASIY